MKIVHIENLVSCGEYASSSHWKTTKASIHEAVVKCDWPAGSGTFTINPEKKGNGVVPIKKEFIQELRMRGWLIEGRAKNQEGRHSATSTQSSPVHPARSSPNGRPATSPPATAP